MAVDQVINLSANGGDASAGEIAKTSAALNGVSNVSKGMEEQFSHRFTHIGLQMFAGDLLRTSGLGAETRQIVGTMQTAIMGASSAFGAAAGPILLVVSGLTAVVAIAAKVIDKHGEEAVAIQKVIDAQSKQKAGYDSEIKSLQDYAAAGGNVTKAMSDLLKADQAVANQIQTSLLEQQSKEIEALIKQRDEIGKQQAVHDAWTKALAVVKGGMLEVAKTIGDAVIPGISLFADGVKSLISHFQGMFGAIGQHITLTGQFKEKYDQLTAAIAKMQVTHQQTASHVVADFAKMAQAAEDHKNKVIQATMDEMNERRTADEAENARELQGMDNRVERFIADKQKEVEANQKALEQQQKAADQIFKQIGSDVGNAFAAMIVKGESFTKAMSDAFSRMAEQIISDLIRIIIEQELLLALEEMTGTQGIASSGGGLFGGAFASGGSAVVSQPTLFLAGEAGPEIASFTPVGAGGGSSGGGGGVGQVNINLNVDHIEGNSPAATLDMLSQEIRRQTVAGRIFATTVAGVANNYPNQAF